MRANPKKTNHNNGRGEAFKASFDQWMITVKNWMKKAADLTFEESKVLAIRAKEAGKLTSLNAQKYKLNREYMDVCAQLGKEVIGLDLSGRGEDAKSISSHPKIQELISKAEHLQQEIKALEEKVRVFKRECDQEVEKVQKKAA